MPMKKKKVYQRKEHIDHILTRPDTYVGSTRMRKAFDNVATRSGKGGDEGSEGGDEGEKESNEYTIQYKEISFSPALLRIFVEPLSNAIDNVERSKSTDTPCTKIKVTIDRESGETCIWNDGDVVDIEKNEEEGCYNHSLIFGTLLTGSNYDDTEDREGISGRNGLGVKLTNIFSSSFKVTGVDPEREKKFTQTWSNNMRETTDPKITSSKLKNGYTEVKWTPDFSQFGIKGYTDDIISLYTRYVIDTAMLTKVNVSLNGVSIKVKTLEKYSSLYKDSSKETLLIKSPSSQVLVTPCTSFHTVSFVNGVYTRLGGTHVDAWSEAIFRPIVNKMNKKGKPQINIGDVKRFFRLFIISTVSKPEFDSQNKEKLEYPKVEAEVNRAQVNKMMKWSIIEHIEDIIRSKEMLALKKTEDKKRGYVKVEKLDRANNDHSNRSSECMLIICEGDSAKAYAVSGIDKGMYGKKGRDWFGIYPVTGKILNTRNSSSTTISKNKTISAVIKAIGLRYDVDYKDDKNFKKLHYGKIVLMTDADVDGIHIEGLSLNMFHNLFPSLFERKEPFIVSMKTPIVRVFASTKKGEDKLFYDEEHFKEYSKGKKFRKKPEYYKGLGTIPVEQVEDTFGLKLVEYDGDEGITGDMNKVFSKKMADARKEWMKAYDPSSYYSLDKKGVTVRMNVSEFLDRVMIKFSLSDCKRSIPNAIDGLKESQRKILFAAKKKGLKYSGETLKVAQFGGYVSEHSSYHHGEQNLYETITKMAVCYPGSNNIPIFYRSGQFGTRIKGGKDAASARYIKTKFDSVTHLIFRDEDKDVLDYLEDDGVGIEPKYYVPIIPMILVNGCNAGIGTGWSTNVPNYNPIDVMSAVRAWIKGGGVEFASDSLLPWYRGFEGKIEKTGEGKYKTYGVLERGERGGGGEKKKKRGGVEEAIVTELPIGMWTETFKEKCEDWKEGKKIKSFKNNSTVYKPIFTIKETEDGFICNLDNLGLTTTLSTTNMTLFDGGERIKEYKKVGEIIDDFCKVRLEYYKKRKAYLLASLDEEIKIAKNKERFIREVVDGKLVLMNVEENVVVEKMKESGYDKVSGGYDYLLQMHVRTFTRERIAALEKAVETLRGKRDSLEKTAETDMWLREIDELEKGYEKWMKDIRAVESKGEKMKGKRGKGKEKSGKK